ncbi:MAG: Smr/MutS family protein [Desulfuromonas sp.]|nr:Smr/MutS family protein [Desulfuromonas sp.]
MNRDRQDRNSINHSPFKSLKGLSVSGDTGKKAAKPAAPVTPAVAEEAEEQDLFAREMAWLNVRPVADGSNNPPAGSPPTPPVPAEPLVNGEVDEFLAAVGTLDKNFRDEFPDRPEPSRARPRRMKQVERGELRPSGELDLHGLTRDEALARTRAFLAQAVRQRWPVVVIVTGKGLHSPEGPVLRRAVEQLLGQSGDLVLEWGEAPRRFGGAGALLVFVRTGGPRG